MNQITKYVEDTRSKRIMDYRFNQLTILPELSNQLIILQLSNNLFEKIQISNNLHQLIFLDLSNNLINCLMINLPKLNYLNIKNNKLQNISQLENLQQLIEIDIGQNLFSENYQIEKLQEFYNLRLILGVPFQIFNSKFQAQDSNLMVDILDLKNSVLKQCESQDDMFESLILANSSTDFCSDKKKVDILIDELFFIKDSLHQSLQKQNNDYCQIQLQQFSDPKFKKMYQHLNEPKCLSFSKSDYKTNPSFDDFIEMDDIKKISFENDESSEKNINDIITKFLKFQQEKMVSSQSYQMLVKEEQISSDFKEDQYSKLENELSQLRDKNSNLIQKVTQIKNAWEQKKNYIAYLENQNSQCFDQLYYFIQQNFEIKLQKHDQLKFEDLIKMLAKKILDIINDEEISQEHQNQIIELKQIIIKQQQQMEKQTSKNKEENEFLHEVIKKQQDYIKMLENKQPSITDHSFFERSMLQDFNQIDSILQENNSKKQSQKKYLNNSSPNLSNQKPCKSNDNRIHNQVSNHIDELGKKINKMECHLLS